MSVRTAVSGCRGPMPIGECYHKLRNSVMRWISVVCVILATLDLIGHRGSTLLGSVDGVNIRKLCGLEDKWRTAADAHAAT